MMPVTAALQAHHLSQNPTAATQKQKAGGELPCGTARRAPGHRLTQLLQYRQNLQLAGGCTLIYVVLNLLEGPSCGVESGRDAL